ncbi:MAG TPA: NTP transferase domain-containing protein, partial [Ktedonobacterales bacterium]|nr:NTP transferase domain-containing protein [Ktedonobacterales bacterium]
MSRTDLTPNPSPTRRGEPEEAQSAIVAVVLGAGQGTRMGVGRNKVLLMLRGKPILVHALAAFEQT